MQQLKCTVMHFILPAPNGFHSNFKQTYLGIVHTAERELTLIDRDLRNGGKVKIKISLFLLFSKYFTFSYKNGHGHLEGKS